MAPEPRPLLEPSRERAARGVVLRGKSGLSQREPVLPSGTGNIEWAMGEYLDDIVSKLIVAAVVLGVP